MGFCLLNNVAIGACHALGLGYRRVGIIDWDVHHGNGTQDIFYADAAVFYGSVHQAPAYPGTGDASETGSGPGRGATLNLPLPPGSGDAAFGAAVETLAGALEVFGAEIVFVSAGFDAHERDPLADCRVTDRGFRRMAETVMETAGRVAGGKVIAVLEGGYDRAGLAGGVRETVDVMLRNSR
jgi:acetoin utilization deacetylase AcuC-like enzyme